MGNSWPEGGNERADILKAEDSFRGWGRKTNQGETFDTPQTTRLTVCYMLNEAKNYAFFSGNAVVRDAFLLRHFFYLSLTHAPIFHRSMLWILWMQQNT